MDPALPSVPTERQLCGLEGYCTDRWPLLIHLYPKSVVLAQTGHSSIPVPVHFQSPELPVCGEMGSQVLLAAERSRGMGWLGVKSTSSEGAGARAGAEAPHVVEMAALG